MQKQFAFLITLSFSCLFCFIALAQKSAVPESNAAMADSLVALYRKSFGQQEKLFGGSEYMGYVRRPKGHPFFNYDQFQPAEISFEGAQYFDSLLYDIVDDALILRNYGTNYNLKLVNEKINMFNIGGHQFERVVGSLSGNALEPGFYEILYNGKLKLFVRHRKQINAVGELESEYVQYDTYFVQKGDEYFRISSSKSLLQSLSERKGEVRRYLHEHKLDFRKDPENTTRKAVEFFDQINK